MVRGHVNSIFEDQRESTLQSGLERLQASESERMCLLGAQELGCSKERLSELMSKALPRKDPLAFKVLRNLSQHGPAVLHALFVPYMKDIISILLVRT